MSRASLLGLRTWTLASDDVIDMTAKSCADGSILVKSCDGPRSGALLAAGGEDACEYEGDCLSGGDAGTNLSVAPTIVLESLETLSPPRIVSDARGLSVLYRLVTLDESHARLKSNVLDDSQALKGHGARMTPSAYGNGWSRICHIRRCLCRTRTVNKECIYRYSTMHGISSI